MTQRNENGVPTITTSEAVEAFRAVTYSTTANTAGYCGAGGRCDGFTLDAAASGDPVAISIANCPGTFKATMATSCSVGDLLYTAASGKLSTTPSGPAVAMALDAATGDGSIIEVLRVFAGSGGEVLLYSNTAASSTHTNTTTPTLLDVNFTIPANVLKAGDVLEIESLASVPSGNSTDTLTDALMIGGVSGTAVGSTGTFDPTNGGGDIVHRKTTLQIRTAGASGTVVGMGTQCAGVPGTATAKSFQLASTTIDTTAAQQIGVRHTWSAASASDQSILQSLVITLKRK